LRRRRPPIRPRLPLLRFAGGHRLHPALPAAEDDFFPGGMDREAVDRRTEHDSRVDLLLAVVGPADRIPVVEAGDDESLHESHGTAGKLSVHGLEAELQRFRIPDPHRDVLAAGRPRGPGRMDREIAEPVMFHLDLPERLAAVAAPDEERT